MTTIRNAKAMRYFIHLFYSFFYLYIICFRPLFCYAVLCVLFSFAIIPLGKRARCFTALLILSSRCHVAVISLCRFLKVPSVVCGV